MFEILTTQQLIDKVKAFKFTRKIKQLHIHHTWKPDHADYNGSNGLKLQQAMSDYHTKVNGWQAIGQHLTLLPDGQWVTGRDFNLDPASIAGWNSGAFAIEMLGNFDIGHDTFGGKQAEAVYTFSSFFVKFMNLDIDADLKFHRDNPAAHKTCPGTSIDKTTFLKEVKSKMELTYEQAIEIISQKAGISAEYWLKKKDIDPYFAGLMIKIATAIK